MSTDERISERTLARWTQSEIDVALVTATSKRDKARVGGDQAEVDERNRWINRLLDARPYHRK